MNVRPEPGIVGQVETRVIRILVDHDRVRIPNPIRDVRIIVRRNAEVDAIEPEPVRTAALEAKNMTRPETQGEPSVLPGVIEVIVCIIATLVVANPLAVGMHMRCVRVPFIITEIALLRRRLLSGALFRSALRGSGSLPLFGGPLLRSLPGGWRGTVGWDISAANPAVLAAPAPISILRHAWYCKAHREQR